MQEEQGLLAGNNGATASWQYLVQLCMFTGRLQESEKWYSKALAAFRAEDDWLNVARTLSNLAILFAKDLTRLDDARRLAEESLAIFVTLDPAIAELWKTYNILAHIASQQGDSSRAAACHTKAEQAFAPYAGRE